MSRTGVWMMPLIVVGVVMGAPMDGYTQTSQPPDETQWKQQAEDLLNRVGAAQVSSDLATLENLFAEDFSYVHSTGSLETKSEFLDAVRTKRRQYHSIDLDEVKVRIYGETAVLTGVADISMALGTREIRLHLRFLTLLVRQQGRWQMAAWQSTPIASQSGGTRSSP